MNLTLSTFFYLWYGNPSTDGYWNHWNHTVLPHWTPSVNEQYPNVGTSHDPPSSIHSVYYPSIGPYSSSNTTTLKSQFLQMSSTTIQVAILSWWGRPGYTKGDTQGTSTDKQVGLAIKATEGTGVKVAFHMEPYEGRDIQSFKDDVSYLVSLYGSSPNLHRVNGKPVFYVYDSYHIPYDVWRSALPSLKEMGFFYGLVLNKGDLKGVVDSGFDGGYTYFSQDGFTPASSSGSWFKLCNTLRAGGLRCDISVGPGYDDSRIRPWNRGRRVERRKGDYYVERLNKALNVHPDGVSITSFNEWGEGTQIEPAGERVEGGMGGIYGTEYGEPYGGLYLGLTKKIVGRWRRDNEVVEEGRGGGGEEL